MTNLLLTLVIATTTLLYSTSAAAEEADARQRQLQHQLNTEGISAWKKIQEASQRLEVSGTQTRRMANSSNVTSREQWQFKYRAGAMLAKSIEFRPGDQGGFFSGECRVRGVNSRYAFQIASKDGRSFDVYGFGTSTLKKSLAASIERYANMITDAPWTAVGISLPVLLQRPEFTLLDISEENIDGHQGIRAEYEFSPSPLHGNHDELYQKGWFRVDRGRQWRLQQLEATVHAPGDPEHIVKFRVNVEYNEDRNGLPVPKRLTIVRGDGENATEQQFEYRVCDYRLLPDRDFTLSAFGLPEPNAAARQPDIDVVASTSLDGTTLHVNVANRSPRPIRLVGSYPSCGEGGGLLPMNDDSGPRVIESGGKMSLAFPIQRMPGRPFSGAAPLFFDDTGTLRHFVIRVSGDGDVLRTTVEDGSAE